MPLILLAALVWESPCAFTGLEQKPAAEQCDYLLNKKLSPELFNKKAPEEQKTLVDESAKVLQEYTRRRAELLARGDLKAPEIDAERARAAALFGLKSKFLEPFDLKKRDLQAQAASERAKGKTEKLGALAKAGDNAAAGNAAFDANTRDQKLSTTPPRQTSGGGPGGEPLPPEKSGSQLQKGAAAADATQARFAKDSGKLPTPPVDTEGFGPLGMRAFKPAADDAGGKDIARMYRTVYATHGENKLGNNITGSMVGNMYDMKEEMLKEDWDKKVTGMGSGLSKAGALTVDYALGIPVDVAVIGQSLADKTARATFGRVLPRSGDNPALPTLPEKDDTIIVAARPTEGASDRKTEGPFMICSEWQAAIEKTSMDPRNKLDFKDYKMYTPAGGVFGPLRTSHNWVSYVNCEKGTVVVADPWRYGKQLKEVPATPENVSYHTAGQQTSCP